MKIMGREPTLFLGVAYAVITTFGTLGWAHLTGEQAALVNAVIAAIVGCINAWAVRPISPVSFTYAIAALVQLGTAYGITVPDATLAAINGLVVPVLALVTRNQVSPVETAVTKQSAHPTPEAAKHAAAKNG